MTPNDDFYFLNYSQISVDHTSLIKCYYPLIGPNGFALYLYFAEFNDGGQKRHKISEILNHLMFSPKAYNEALDRLMALQLIHLFEDKRNSAFYIEIKQALRSIDFLENAVYRNMLENCIGEYSVSLLYSPNQENLEDVTKPFSEVFKVNGSTQSVSTERQLEADTEQQFDYSRLKQLMARDGYVFENESRDLPRFFSMADQHRLKWFELYEIAKRTAIQHKFSIERLYAKLNLRVASNGQQEFSHQERVILQEVKETDSQIFLAKLKSDKKAMITSDEYRLIEELQQKAFLDEVINVLILFTMNRVDSVNLNRNYIEKVANSFLSESITSAEQAIIYLRPKHPAQGKTKSTPKKKQGNNPNWSEPNYVNQTSEQRKKELEELRKQTLEKLNKGGD